jgi:hypothetical protein
VERGWIGKLESVVPEMPKGRSVFLSPKPIIIDATKVIENDIDAAGVHAAAMTYTRVEQVSIACE